MRVLLLNPNLEDIPKLRWTGEHLGLAYLASALRDNSHIVHILDADLQDLDINEIILFINFHRPKLLGISCTEENSLSVHRLCKLIKESFPDIKICIGGHFATLSYRHFINNINIDYVCLGEGENLIVELADCLDRNLDESNILGLVSKRNINSKHLKPVHVDLSFLTPAARDTSRYVLEQGDPLLINSSRGCYGKCLFCSIRAFYGSCMAAKWRSRSPEEVITEILELVINFNIKEVAFTDDNFIGPFPDGPKRASKIAELLSANPIRISFSINCRANDVDLETFTLLKYAGLSRVFIGFESFDNHVLKRLKKGTSLRHNLKAISILNSLNIEINPSLIMFTPWTSINTIRDNIYYLEKRIKKFNISVFLSQLWKLSGTIYAEGSNSIRLEPAEIRESKAADFYGILFPRLDELLSINTTLGRLARNKYKNNASITYSKFQNKFLELYIETLGQIEDLESNMPVQCDLISKWMEFTEKWEKITNSLHIGYDETSSTYQRSCRTLKEINEKEVPDEPSNITRRYLSVCKGQQAT